ncbi:hypothetical protein [Gramella sp. AN32]|uniref:Uncharacterized protein n=1 Tax=Christiangramia antarctica TaxID=2058158 RepID=A0ABW5XAQ1_9FLAO|nr:hypothetical protein [Gramella sp. AN32]MCM4158173.1 hypothetical protein [Gramella sp. AN32]
MKITRFKLVNVLVLCILLTTGMTAQESKNQMFLVHEDYVRPGMSQEHEKVDTELKKAVLANGMEAKLNWLTVVNEEGLYRYLVPMQNYAMLDNDPFEELQKKMGKEKFDAMMNKYKDNYSQHGDYFIHLDNDLSYMPDGISQTQTGKNYRNLIVFTPKIGMATEFRDQAKKIKEIFSAKGSKMHYRVYNSGIGVMPGYFMVAISASNQTEMDSMSEANNKLLGEEFANAYTALIKMCDKVKTERAWIREDLSILPKN